MKRSDPVRLGSVLDDFFSSSPTIARKIAEAKVASVWPKVVGEKIAFYTTSVSAENGKATVHISSSVVRHEVFLRRTEIKDAINEALGSVVVRVIDIK
ncbi:MAG: DUF721 domain-containing protein [Rikenellaceae bacterium]